MKSCCKEVAMSESHPSDASSRQQPSQQSRTAVWRLTNCADTCRSRGRYAEAERLFLQALALAETVLGRDDLEVSTILNNLGVLYKYMGRFDEGARMYRRAFEIMQASLSPNHPEMATIYHN